MFSAIADARPLGRELAQPLPQLRIVAAPRAIMPPRATEADHAAHAARTRLLRTEGGQEKGDDLPPLSRRHHFRPATSFSIAMSSA